MLLELFIFGTIAIALIVGVFGLRFGQRLMAELSLPPMMKVTIIAFTIFSAAVVVLLAGRQFALFTFAGVPLFWAAIVAFIGGGVSVLRARR